MTSASHVAEMARQKARVAGSVLSRVNFIDRTITIIGGETDTPEVIGMTDAELPSIVEALDTVSQSNALIAYLMEAVKEKESLMESAKGWVDVEARKALEELRASRGTVKRGTSLTSADVMRSWSVGEQEKYLSLEAKASAIGKFIHEDGALDKARRALLEVSSKPIEVDANGRDTLIHKNTASVDIEKVDALYFELQKRHREVQSELNGMKKRIADAVSASEFEVAEAYNNAKEMEREFHRELERKEEEIREREAIKRKMLMDEVDALKIVIPKRLEGIYAEVMK